MRTELAVGHLRGGDGCGRGAVLDPVDQRRQPVEPVRSDAAAAMEHAGHHEQAEEVGRARRRSWRSPSRSSRCPSAARARCRPSRSTSAACRRARGTTTGRDRSRSGACGRRRTSPCPCRSRTSPDRSTGRSWARPSSARSCRRRRAGTTSARRRRQPDVPAAGHLAAGGEGEAGRLRADRIAEQTRLAVDLQAVVDLLHRRSSAPASGNRRRPGPAAHCLTSRAGSKSQLRGSSIRPSFSPSLASQRA